MKKILFLALAAVLVTSCKKDFTDVQSGVTSKMTIRASIENMETRTTIEYGNPDYTAGEISKWEQGDQIRVFFYDADGIEGGNVVFKAKRGGSNVEFEIDESETNILPSVGSTYTAKALYPKNAHNDISTNEQSQNGTDAGHIGECDLMTSQSSVYVGEGDIVFNLAFTHRLPMLRFTLLNDTGGDITVEDIIVETQNGENTFYTGLNYNIDDDSIRYGDRIANAIKLSVSTDQIVDGAVFDAYMIVVGSMVFDDSDNLCVTVIYNDGSETKQQEFTIPRVSNTFLQSPFEGGKRYYFKLKLTGANIENGTIGDLVYQFNTTEKTAQVIGLAAAVSSIVIPATVSYNGDNYDITSIRQMAFFSETTLDGVTFASGSKLIAIGSDAFARCLSLTGTIEIPASVISIGHDAFKETALTGVTFASGSRLTNIGEEAFTTCRSLTGTIEIPASVTFIGYDAFKGAALTGVTFASGSKLIVVEKEAFAICASLTGTIEIPASVTFIGHEAFRGTALTGVTFASGSQLATIERNIFGGTNITTINMNCMVPPTLNETFFEFSSLTVNVPSSAAGAYNTVINDKSKGWGHNGTLPIVLAGGSSVILSELSGAFGNVTVSATL